mgnify:CR=1 FL=1
MEWSASMNRPHISRSLRYVVISLSAFPPLRVMLTDGYQWPAQLQVLFIQIAERTFVTDNTPYVARLVQFEGHIFFSCILPDSRSSLCLPIKTER